MWFLAEESLNDFLDLRHTGHTANQNHFVNVASLQARIAKSCLAWLDRALNEVVHEAFKLRTRKLDCKVLRTGLVSRDERQVDFGLLSSGKLDLGLFGSFLEALQSKLVFLKIDALFFLELGNQILDQTHIEVFTAEERVTVGGLYFKHAVADFKNRNVERAAAKIVNSDGLAFALIETVSKCCSRWLVDDTQNFKTSDLAGILGCLTLSIIEVCRNRNNSLRHGFAEI